MITFDGRLGNTTIADVCMTKPARFVRDAEVEAVAREILVGVAPRGTIARIYDVIDHQIILSFYDFSW